MGHLSDQSGPAPLDCQIRTRLVFGPGSVERLGEFARVLGGNRVLLVTDSGLVAAGHAARAQQVLTDAGLAVARFDRVRENPTTLEVGDCVGAARDHHADLLVGLGGGSSIDTAKGCNFLLTNGGRMQDYWGVGKATRPMLPLIAIPTTAGTGSECQSAALIADEITHQKMACLDPKAAARIALLDPELTLSLPRRVTACTGIDALSHALESAVTRARNVVSSMFAREAFSLGFPAFSRVLEQPGDLAARGRMLLGAAFAGTAIENSMLGAAHSMANPLTAHFGVPHGWAVGLMLPYVLRFNGQLPENRSIYASLAAAAGCVSREEDHDGAWEGLIRQVEQLLRQAGVPRSLVALGVAHHDLPQLAAEAASQWTAQFNPRPLEVGDFAALYRAAFEGEAA